MLSDAEVVATWMEPKPTYGAVDIVEKRPPYPRWWTQNGGDDWAWRPVLVVDPEVERLGRLHEVEGTLSDHQCEEYLNALANPSLGWDDLPLYDADVSHASAYWYFVHADAPTKIKALASVLRPAVERGLHAEVKRG